MEALAVPGAIVGLVEALKQAGMPTKFAPFVAPALGLVAWLLVGPSDQAFLSRVLEGIGLGALAPAMVFVASRFNKSNG